MHEAILESGVATLSSSVLFDFGAEFHQMLVSCSGNVFLVEALARQQRLQRVWAPNTPSVNEAGLLCALREHVQILDHIEQGQPEYAADSMRKHLDASVSPSALYL